MDCFEPHGMCCRQFAGALWNSFTSAEFVVHKTPKPRIEGGLFLVFGDFYTAICQ